VVVQVAPWHGQPKVAVQVIFDAEERRLHTELLWPGAGVAEVRHGMVLAETVVLQMLAMVFHRLLRTSTVKVDSVPRNRQVVRQVLETQVAAT
jgi:hypothetical protein